MTTSISLARRLGFVARMIGAFAGPPIARWSPRPPLPIPRHPQAVRLPRGVTLWRLPVGLVRIRERHRAMPAEFAEVPDPLRFPVMMADRRITGWLDCTAWLIDHPERRILVDTGESMAFGTAPYFDGVPTMMARTYPKIIDATAAPGQDLVAALAAAGVAPAAIDVCVLTHTHSDHVGHLDQLAAATRILVSPEEVVPRRQSGRLLGKLPRDGRVQLTSFDTPHPVFGQVAPLTERGDVFVMRTPGHTTGHQSVVVDIGERQIVLAGDAAFADEQVASGVLPGIVEDAAMTRATYDVLRRARADKPTLTLFTHDPANASKLESFVGAHDPAASG